MIIIVNNVLSKKFAQTIFFMFFINLSHIIPIFLCIIALQAAPVRGSLKVLSMYLFVVCLARTKNVPWHILAPAVVACDIFSIRRSAHPAGGFLYNRKCNFLLYKKRSIALAMDLKSLFWRRHVGIEPTRDALNAPH